VVLSRQEKGSKCFILGELVRLALGLFAVNELILNSAKDSTGVQIDWD